MGLFSNVGSSLGSIVNLGTFGLIGSSGPGTAFMDTLAGKPGDFGREYNVNQEAFAATPQQQQFLEDLQRQYYGNVPGQAEEFYKNISAADLQNARMLADQNANAMASQMASTRGVQNPVLLARQIQEQGALQGQQNAANLTEQQLRSAAGAAGIKSEERQNLQNTMANQANLQQQSNIAGENARFNAFSDYEKRKVDAIQGARESQAQIIGGLGQAGASIAGAKSDINMKQNIQPGQADIKSMLDSLSPYSYEYKSQPGVPQSGIMAQDLERTPAGQGMVVDRPDGKYVQPNATTMLAADALNNERLNNIEDFLKIFENSGEYKKQLNDNINKSQAFLKLLETARA